MTELSCVEYCGVKLRSESSYTKHRRSREGVSPATPHIVAPAQAGAQWRGSALTLLLP